MTNTRKDHRPAGTRAHSRSNRDLKNYGQPPSIIEQRLQSNRLLSHEEEIRYTKIIRDNYCEIVKSVSAINSSSPNIVKLQIKIGSWQKKDKGIKPGKKHLDYIMKTLYSACSGHTHDEDTSLLCARFRMLAAEIEAARSIMITANLRLVCSIAKRYTDRGLSLSDLVQEGCLGLMRAVFRFNHNTGKRFSTYASWWIKQAITRAIPARTRTIKLPAHFLVAHNHFNKSYVDLKKNLGRSPTMTELASETYMGHDKILAIIQTSQEPKSLEEPIGDNSQNLMELLTDRKVRQPEDVAVAADLHKQIDGMLNTLSPREAQVLRMRFGIDRDNCCTLDQVGQQFSVSRERIRQIEQEALQRLRHPGRCDHMRCFLEA